MGYGTNNAKMTGKLTEEKAAAYLNSHGFIAKRPLGKDIGIDLEIRNGRTGRVFTAQVKGRGRVEEPRWFQVSMGGQEVQRAWHENRLQSLWLDKIQKTDYWILISLPADEIWVIPSEEIVAIARANESKYAGRSDNQFGAIHHKPDGTIAKKQKELNLDLLINGQPLWKTYAAYRNSVRALDR